MAEDKPIDPNQNPEKEKHEADFEADIKGSKDGIEKMKSDLLRYAPKQVKDQFDKLQEYPALAEKDPNAAEIKALESDLAGMISTADADCTDLATNFLNKLVNKYFADADRELAVGSGASQDEESKMRQEEDDLDGTEEDRERAQTELLMLALALAAREIKVQVDSIRLTGTGYEARKLRALDNVATLSISTSEITIRTAEYELDDLNIGKKFTNLSGVFKALAKDKNDPQGNAFLQASEKFADRALADAVRVLKLAIEGYVAYLFLQAQMQAMSTSELWDSRLQESTKNMTTIIMTSLASASGSDGNQVSVFGAALLHRPIVQILARRSA